MGKFRFTLVCFCDGGKGDNSGDGLASFNESCIVGSVGDVLGVAETSTAKDAVKLEGIKGLSGARQGGSVT